MKISAIPKKTWIGLIVLIILVILAGYFIIQKKKKDATPIHNITSVSGQVTSARADGVITMKGVYLGSDVPENMGGSQDITFKASSSTTFEKTVIKFPTTEAEAKKLGDSFSLSQLPKEVIVGSLDDLESLTANQDKAIFIKVDFEKSIYQKDSPLASKVQYMITESTPPQQSTEQ